VRCAGGSTGAELRLDRPDGRGLRFGVRDSIYPTQEPRPLLRGQRGGGYQFGWQAGNGLIWLQWEWRDGPGKPWGFAGMNREPTTSVPQPDLLVGPPAPTSSCSASCPGPPPGCCAGYPAASRRCS
jgi:hypothetical protein